MCGFVVVGLMPALIYLGYGVLRKVDTSRS